MLRESLMHEMKLPDEAATIELGRRIADLLPGDTAGWTLLLRGELGAGKSTFARALLSAMGHQGSAPSPTYTLIEPYELAGRMIYHIDLYRVSNVDELEYLGWSDLSDGLRVIEWPERVPGIEAQSDLTIKLDYAAPGRVAVFTANSDRGHRILAGMDLN